MPEVAVDVQDILDLFNGRPVKFSEAGLILIQKRAFELAAGRKTSASKLNSLLRVLSYQKQAELNERRVKATEMAAEARLLTAEAAMIRAAADTGLKRQKNAPAPENPAEVVMQRCGSANKFFQQLRDGERVTHCIQRLYNDIKNGTFKLEPPRPGDDWDAEREQARQQQANQPSGAPDSTQLQNIIPLNPLSPSEAATN